MPLSIADPFTSTLEQFDADALDAAAVDIAFPEKKAREVGAVLTGYAGDEGHLVR